MAAIALAIGHACMCMRDAEIGNVPFLAALAGELRRCSSLVWLATQRSERLALHPVSTAKNGTLLISASLSKTGRTGSSVSLGSRPTPLQQVIRQKSAGVTACAVAPGTRRIRLQPDLTRNDYIDLPSGTSFFLSLPAMNGLHGLARTGPDVFQTTLN